VAGQLRLDLASYNELASFAQFASELDKVSQQKLQRGQRMVELLKQGQFSPMDVAEQVLSLFTGVKGLLDDVPVNRVREFEAGFLNYVRTKAKDVLDEIRKGDKMSDALLERIKKLVTDFKQGFK
jgi:F-type H+-transporting ATPase subunit alpha